MAVLYKLKYSSRATALADLTTKGVITGDLTWDYPTLSVVEVGIFGSASNNYYIDFMSDNESLLFINLADFGDPNTPHTWFGWNI